MTIIDRLIDMEIFCAYNEEHLCERILEIHEYMPTKEYQHKFGVKKITKSQAKRLAKQLVPEMNKHLSIS